MHGIWIRWWCHQSPGTEHHFDVFTFFCVSIRKHVWLWYGNPVNYLDLPAKLKHSQAVWLMRTFMWFIAKLPQMIGLFKAPSVFCLCKTESISLHSFANIQLSLEHGKKVMCVWRDSHSNSPQKSEFADWFTHFIARSEEHWLLFQGLGLGF